MLYHGTSSKRLPKILKNGLKPGSHWGSEDVALFFARQSAREDHGRAILIVVDSSALVVSCFQIDNQMVEFPIFSDYDIRQNEWELLDNPTELDGLRIFDSVVYRANVPVTPAMVRNCWRSSIHA